MSLELLNGQWYITTACRSHDDGEPCSTCWPHTCKTHQPERDFVAEADALRKQVQG